MNKVNDKNKFCNYKKKSIKSLLYYAFGDGEKRIFTNEDKIAEYSTSEILSPKQYSYVNLFVNGVLQPQSIYEIIQNQLIISSTTSPPILDSTVILQFIIFKPKCSKKRHCKQCCKLCNNKPIVLIDFNEWLKVIKTYLVVSITMEQNYITNIQWTLFIFIAIDKIVFLSRVCSKILPVIIIIKSLIKKPYKLLIWLGLLRLLGC